MPHLREFQSRARRDQLASEFCQLLTPITRVGVHLCKWTFYEFNLDEPVAHLLRRPNVFVTVARSTLPRGFTIVARLPK